MAKYRSSTDFSQIYAGNHQGYAIGIENYCFVASEVTAGTFVAGSIPTQGTSTSDATASIDISAGTASSFKVAVDGGVAVTAVIPSLLSLDTGVEIAAAVELAANTALAAGGQDGRVWCEFVSGNTSYVIYSQKCGATSAVVVTDATSNNVAAVLKLGVANAGTEVVGAAAATNPFLWMTSAGFKRTQDFDISKHRTGRQPSGVIRKKIMVEGDLETYVNLATGGSATVDNALSLLLEACFGKKTVGVSSISYDNTQAPSKYLSFHQSNNIFARSINGAYPKNWTLSLPGDGPATMKMSMKARDAKECSIAQVNGAVNASGTIILNAGEAGRFEATARVMAVMADGKTVVAGADGSLTVTSIDTVTHTVVVGSAVTLDDNSFLVPWMPQVFGYTGTDNPATDLTGSLSLDGGSTTIEQITSVEIGFDAKVEDLDGFYGSDGNRGFVVGDQAEITVKVEFLLSSDMYAYLMKAKRYEQFSIKAVVGAAAGRRIEISCPHVQVNSPAIEIPENGSIKVSLEGRALQASGLNDAITLTFL
jgi:hypothetical protein